MRRTPLLLSSLLVALVACGDSGSSTDVDAGGGPDANKADTGGNKDAAVNDSSTSDSSTGDSSTGDASTGDGGGAPLTIFTVLFENHDYAEIVGSANAPYFNSLIASYGLATNYNDSGVHPSLPNYLVLASGDAQYPGIIDVDPTQVPYFPAKKANLGTQLQAKGVKWRSYQESMGTACKLTGAGTYAPKHDPFLYFDDMQNGANGLCAATNVDYSQFAADLSGGTYRFMWITPNLTNDGHDPANDPVAGIKQSDKWASTNIDAIMQSAAYKANGIIFITWDEAEGRNNDSKSLVPMIIVSPKIKAAGYKSAVKYSHKSWLATVEDLLGMPRLATVTNETPMTEFFK